MGNIHGVNSRVKVLLGKLIADRGRWIPLASIVKSPEDTNMIELLLQHGCIKIVGDNVKVVDIVRLVLTMVELGLDIYEASWWLTWGEFEKLASLILIENGFNTVLNFRFKYREKRYEVDLIAWKFRYMYIIDCKQWFHKGKYKLKQAAEKQEERAKALSNLYAGNHFRLYPVILSVYNMDNAKGVPIVPLEKFLRFDTLQFDSPTCFSVGKQIIKDLENREENNFRVRLGNIDCKHVNWSPRGNPI